MLLKGVTGSKKVVISSLLNCLWIHWWSNWAEIIFHNRWCNWGHFVDIVNMLKCRIEYFIIFISTSCRCCYLQIAYFNWWVNAKKCISIANALESRLSCTNPSHCVFWHATFIWCLTRHRFSISLCQYKSYIFVYYSFHLPAMRFQLISTQAVSLGVSF